MKKKKVIFSYDYELFFGIMSGTVQKTLIEPTNLLLDCMESVSARGNFFIDYLMFECLEKLSDERAKSDLKLMKRAGEKIWFDVVTVLNYTFILIG